MLKPLSIAPSNRSALTCARLGSLESRAPLAHIPRPQAVRGADALSGVRLRATDRVEAGVKASMSYCINRTVSISSDP